MPPVIDHHAHINLNYGHRHRTGAEEVLRGMDEAGVDRSILIDLSALYGGDYRPGNDFRNEFPVQQIATDENGS